MRAEMGCFADARGRRRPDLRALRLDCLGACVVPSIAMLAATAVGGRGVRHVKTAASWSRARDGGGTEQVNKGISAGDEDKHEEEGD